MGSRADPPYVPMMSMSSALEQTFGSQELERLHRLTEGGPAPASLTEELSEIESLFLGAHVCVSRELGLAPDTSMGSNTSTSEAAERFVTWRRELNSDPDLNLDLRAMVPVFYDVARRKLKVWAFLGWRSEEHTSELQSHHDLVCRLLL